MITAWIVFGFVTSVAVSVAALSLEQLLRMQRHSTRWVWIAAMAAPMLFACAGMWSSTPQVSAASRSLVEAVPQRDASNSSFLHNELVSRASSVAQAFDLDRIAAIAWACASGALVLVLCHGAIGVRRRVRTSARIFGEDLAVGDAIGPAVVGFVRPRIVVPTWFLALDVATQRTALLHEREHIVAHDSRLIGAALLLLVAMPWNVPLWWQFRRLRAAIEVDCDARVLRRGVAAHAYGLTLLSVAEHRSKAFLFAPSMSDAAAALERRIKLLFSPQVLHAKSVAVLLGACAIGSTLAAAQVEPPADIVKPIRVAGTTPSASQRPGVSGALGRALIEAAQSNDTDTARAMIAEGADVNHVMLGDGTPLILAARHGNAALVRELLAHGADANLPTPGDGNPLIMAAAHGRLEIVAELMQRGADVNAIVIGDETPLINAARRGHLAVVEHLVKHGADVNLSAPESSMPLAEIRSPLSEAKKYGRLEVVRFLEANGASAR
jgi:beta-lactamase regulating signal transducer with metallopeptidase domain